MGYGVYGNYAVTPSIKITFDYKMANYTLDSNGTKATYGSSDIRLGAGYYY